MSFQGETVLITGAAGGIGAALCRKFARASAHILALDMNRDALMQVINDLRSEGCFAQGVFADITQGEALKEKLREAAINSPPISVLVNNAGGGMAKTLKETTDASWRKDIGLNLDGAFNCVEFVRMGMVENRRGAIVNIASVNGLMALGHPAYSAAKAGLISYTKALALELGAYGVRANVVCPGTVKTQLWDERVSKNPELMDDLLKWYPLGCLPDVDDIAEAAYFLASPQAKAITGVVLPVDAGLTAGNLPLARELTQEEL